MFVQTKPNQTPLYVMRIAILNIVRINGWWSLGARTNRNKMCIYLSYTIIFLSEEMMWRLLKISYIL